MAELKTKQTKASVSEFLAKIENLQQRNDCLELQKMLAAITGKKAKMWGPSMVGFGKYHYIYDSGHEGDSFVAGFSPRKGHISLYVMSGFIEFESILKNLGKFKTAKSCLYIKTLDDVDRDVFKELLKKSVLDMHKRYKCS